MSSNPKLVMTGIAVLPLSDKRIYTNVRKEDRNILEITILRKLNS